MSKLMSGETLLWEGRPDWRAVARDVLHIRILAGYFGLMLIWEFAADRADGWSPLNTLWRGTGLFVTSVVMLLLCAGFAWAIARTTRYTVTTERCILSYGLALTATLSVPLRRVALVAVDARSDGRGDILLTPKPGPRLRYVKLWPHARPWRWSRAEPMLRGVPHVMDVAAALSQAAKDAAPGIIHAAPAVRAQPGSILPEATWSGAGD